MSTRSFPGPGGCKPALAGVAAAAILLVGCGSDGSKGPSAKVQDVVGVGYRFSAPSSWRVRRSGRTVAASSGAVDLVGVTTFPLARRYEPRLWAKVAPALDRAAVQLTAQLGGRLEARETIVLAGRRARRYEIGYRRSSRRLVERTAFVLDGRREHQLLCRFQAGGDDGACRMLFRTFRPE
ncbi:MAG TPA: hypothetical protein VE596_06550 [Gaiellaceae bacterium]|nr:hypothetical protein [Gaiellaceae bacterium]